MRKVLGFALLCAASSLSAVHAETFLIEAAKAGHESTITIPAGAVKKLSADRAETLDSYAGASVEAMRLSGDVAISIVGSTQPIEIKADHVVVELTADSAPGGVDRGHSDVASTKVLRPTSKSAGGEDSQVFVGNVVFDLQTSSGPVQIKADKVEHQAGNEPGA